MQETTLTLTEHLAELRSRALKALAAVALGAVAGFALYDAGLLDLIRAPFDAVVGRTDNPYVGAFAFLNRLLPEKGTGAEMPLNLHFFSPIEVFMVKLKVSLLAGVILTSPAVFWQIWAFVAAGLTAREKRVVRMFLPVSLCLFAIGIALAWLLMLPVALHFLIVVTGEGLIGTINLSQYTGLVAASCLAFGLVFQLPLALYALTRFGIVTPDFLARRRKYAILLMFVLAALLTPQDVVSQLLMALPMIALYEIGIVVSRLARRRA